MRRTARVSWRRGRSAGWERSRNPMSTRLTAKWLRITMGGPAEARASSNSVRRWESDMVMRDRNRGHLSIGFVAAVALSAASPGHSAVRSIDPSKLPVIGKVDPRYQSYNVEMAEVIGGRFWAPYPKPGDKVAPTGDPAAAMFRKREPLDLKNNRRLRNLAAALAPAYV